MGQQQTDHPLERLIFFSDAVFAIAITLLVIEIHVPAPADAAALGGYGPALAHLQSSFLAFLLSFAVIARFWAGHHKAFSLRARFDNRLILPNFAVLLCIAFLPFSTAFLAKNFGNFIPALFYNVSLLALSLSSMWVVHVATRSDGLMPGVDPADVRLLHARGLAIATGAVLAIALTFVTPQFSQIGLAFALLARLFSRQPKAHATA